MIPPSAAAAAVLTAQDRSDIQDLVRHYARALGSCAPEEWAGLFASPDGVFGSGSRGQVSGREKLSSLVRSEPACTRPAGGSAARGTSAASSADLPGLTIEASPQGATGRMTFGNGGYYEDVYLKTANGWRFKSRNVLSAQEAAANLTIRDFQAIRQLAGDDGRRFDDTYVDTPAAPHAAATPGAAPGRFFRASGLVITVSPDGVKGRAYLSNDGGFYDDVYVKTTAGGWRFQSRVYVSR